MRYTKEFKLECVEKYMNGNHIENPSGCAHTTFRHNVVRWVNIFKQLGEVGLEHQKPVLTVEKKYELCLRIQNGESITSAAISVGRQTANVSKWYKIYLREGISGLQSIRKRGRPPNMKKVDKNFESLTADEQNKKLLKQIERLEIENDYLKKLSALVQKRMDRQQKKK